MGDTEAMYPNFGQVDQTFLYVDDHHCCFIGNNVKLILYLWDSKEWLDNLKVVFARLNQQQASTSVSVSETEAISKQQKRKAKDNKNNEKSQFVQSIDHKGLAELTKSQSHEQEKMCNFMNTYCCREQLLENTLSMYQSTSIPKAHLTVILNWE